MLSESVQECDKQAASIVTKKQVSFEDYYKTWVNIATSKPISLLHRPVRNGDFEDFMMDNDHFGLLRNELEEELKKQLSDHNAIMYGRFRDKRSNDERRIAELQATKSHLLEQIYLENQETGTQLDHLLF